VIEMKTDTNLKVPTLERRSGLRTKIRTIRYISQLAFFAAFLTIATGAVCTFAVGRSISIIEPLGVLQLMFDGTLPSVPRAVLESIIVGSLVFLVVIIFTGRAFCSWACPIGTTIDVVDGLLQKAKYTPFLTHKAHGTQIETTGVPSGMSRYGVVGSVLAGSALFKFPVWCAFCPIGTLCRGSIAGAEVAIGAEFLALPAVGAMSLAQKRFWCRSLCPVGGVLVILSRLNPFFKPKARADRKHNCGACRAICPEGIDICTKGSLVECTKCFDCYSKCPYGSVKISVLG
jgi:ferredoxin-type protein NapH